MDYSDNEFCNKTEELCRSNSCGVLSAKNHLCLDYYCDNGNLVYNDSCTANNPYPNCYNSTCQDNGICSNISTYNGNISGCVGEIVCTESGWIEIPKNCTDIILNDPNTPSYVNEHNASCYEYKCENGGQCVYNETDEYYELKNKENSCRELYCNGSGWTLNDECISNNPYPNCFKSECQDNGICSNISLNDKAINKENQCYEALCGSSGWIIRKRTNATEWEDQLSGCFVFYCDNETGALKRNKCGSNEVCMNDECIKTSSLNDYGSVIILTSTEMDARDLNTTNLRSVLSSISGIEEDKIVIVVETNDKDEVFIIYAIVDNKDDADILADAIQECLTEQTRKDEKEDNCVYIRSSVKRVNVETKVIAEYACTNYVSYVALVLSIISASLFIH